MKPNLSEFSYGYALTDELIHRHGLPLVAAPVFPSLYQEGQPGGGYDVLLERPGFPLFLQFKLADCMVKGTADEIKSGFFTSPFFRMHLRPARHSNQHALLLKLEEDGNEVFYVAPGFHETEELNDAYLRHEVRERSAWIKPSDIGVLPDLKDHHVSFQLPDYFFVCSKPRRLEGRHDLQGFNSTLLEALARQPPDVPLVESLKRLNETLRSIIRPRLDRAQRAVDEEGRPDSPRDLVESVAAKCRVSLGAQLFLVVSATPRGAQPSNGAGASAPLIGDGA